MSKFKVTKSPFKPSDFEIVEAAGFVEEGSYTQFIGVDGGVVLALPTKLVTRIEEVD